MNAKKIAQSTIFFLISAVIFFSCDLFSFEKKIVNNYFLMETDAKSDLAIYYKTSDGNYIGRIPSQILEYGYIDSFIVAKCKKINSINYYIVNRSMDSDFAELKDILTGPLSEKLYREDWFNRLKLKFINVQIGADMQLR